jgi:hypothetical protein
VAAAADGCGDRVGRSGDAVGYDAVGYDAVGYDAVGYDAVDRAAARRY